MPIRPIACDVDHLGTGHTELGSELSGSALNSKAACQLVVDTGANKKNVPHGSVSWPKGTEDGNLFARTRSFDNNGAVSAMGLPWECLPLLSSKEPECSSVESFSKMVFFRFFPVESESAPQYGVASGKEKHGGVDHFFPLRVLLLVFDRVIKAMILRGRGVTNQVELWWLALQSRHLIRHQRSKLERTRKVMKSKFEGRCKQM
ncbi:hypothetical protein BS47DRAFT_1361092 [Hydnum rufescens UP504]|uniref:Uncharacterized protein n=1 Tax=Hydnum rufescens UP504 TaxID=1448309 RepID=A0A9P6DY70_9AGAM|nr:hypothetical protein BS47DRAFT_1361092 [Hydnum rufescens UP504]